MEARDVLINPHPVLREIVPNFFEGCDLSKMEESVVSVNVWNHRVKIRLTMKIIETEAKTKMFNIQEYKSNSDHNNTTFQNEFKKKTDNLHPIFMTKKNDYCEIGNKFITIEHQDVFEHAHQH